MQTVLSFEKVVTYGGLVCRQGQEPLAVVNRLGSSSEGNDGFPPFYPGQSYTISVDLELPESPENVGVGMFMIRIALFSKSDHQVFASSRSV